MGNFALYLSLNLWVFRQFPYVPAIFYMSAWTHPWASVSSSVIGEQPYQSSSVVMRHEVPDVPGCWSVGVV